MKLFIRGSNKRIRRDYNVLIWKKRRNVKIKFVESELDTLNAKSQVSNRQVKQILSSKTRSLFYK